MSGLVEGTAILSWYRPTDHPQDSSVAMWVARGFGGRYAVEEDGLLWFAHDEFVWEKCSSVTAAMARAEADFRERIAPVAAALRGGSE